MDRAQANGRPRGPALRGWGLFSVLAVALWGLAGCTTPPGAADDPPQRLYTVTLNVPDPGWELGIESIRVNEEEKRVWILARVAREPGVVAPQVITEVRASALAPAPVPLDEARTTILIQGRNWEWENTEAYRFLAPDEPLPEAFENAREIFAAPWARDAAPAN